MMRLMTVPIVPDVEAAMPTRLSFHTMTEVRTVARSGANPLVRCAICGQRACVPMRRYVGGTIAEGCIASIHTPFLRPGTLSWEWHYREQAIAWRSKPGHGRIV